jgi:hypothetical protein
MPFASKWAFDASFDWVAVRFWYFTSARCFLASAVSAGCWLEEGAAMPLACPNWSCPPLTSGLAAVAAAVVDAAGFFASDFSVDWAAARGPLNVRTVAAKPVTRYACIFMKFLPGASRLPKVHGAEDSRFDTGCNLPNSTSTPAAARPRRYNFCVNLRPSCGPPHAVVQTMYSYLLRQI